MNEAKRGELLHRADILKQYEVYGYQIAYYLLGNEALATEAATGALMELIKDDEFFGQSPSLQKQKTKQAFMRKSLMTKASSLQTI